MLDREGNPLGVIKEKAMSLSIKFTKRASRLSTLMTVMIRHQ